MMISLASKVAEAQVVNGFVAAALGTERTK